MLPHNDSLGLYMSGRHATLSHTTSCPFGTAAVELYVCIHVRKVSAQQPDPLYWSWTCRHPLLSCWSTLHHLLLNVVVWYILILCKWANHSSLSCLDWCSTVASAVPLTTSACTLVLMPKSDTKCVLVLKTDVRSIWRMSACVVFHWTKFYSICTYVQYLQQNSAAA